ncbi:MAG: PspA/IM30 family protein [Trebonia sp.]
MTAVVDASVVVAGLASADATGQWAESVLGGEPLAAPHLMPAEAASILRRAELAGEISADAASLAHADLGRLRVEYFPYDPFAERIWELRSPGLAAPPSAPERARLFLPPDPASSGTDDPAEALDYSYQQQVEMLRKVRGGVADLDTARKRVELQMTALAESSGELRRRAREALAAGREDLAQESLARKNAVEAELGELREQSQSLRQQTDHLAAASQRLEAKIEAFARRRQKEAGDRSGHPGLTSYEAWYVALAEFLGARLATLDTRLALVPGPRCGFCLPPPPA